MDRMSGMILNRSQPPPSPGPGLPPGRAAVRVSGREPSESSLESPCRGRWARGRLEPIRVRVIILPPAHPSSIPSHTHTHTHTHPHTHTHTPHARSASESESSARRRLHRAASLSWESARMPACAAEGVRRPDPSASSGVERLSRSSHLHTRARTRAHTRATSP